MASLSCLVSVHSSQYTANDLRILEAKGGLGLIGSNASRDTDDIMVEWTTTI